MMRIGLCIALVAAAALGWLDPEMMALAGIFSFGGSKTESQSQSTSESGGFSIGRSQQGSFGASGQVSGSRGVSGSAQSVFGEEFLRQLYGGATSAAMRAGTGGLGQAARSLFTGGTAFLDQLQGSSDVLRERLEGGGDLAEERISLLEQDVGRFLRREALPGVESRAVASGGLGGARQGLAEGRAIEGATREVARGATQIRGEERLRRDQLARDLAETEQTAASVGLQSLPGLFGLAEAEATAELAPFERLSQIIGAPTTLTESFAEESSESVARSLSESFGISMEDARNWARSQSTSSSSGMSMSFGVGPGS